MTRKVGTLLDKNINEALIIKAQNGDTEAFEIIYKNSYNRVYFIAYQYYQNEEIAKDIVQEVFIRVYQKIKQLRKPNTFNAWLRKITYSICVNHSRGKLKTVDLGESKSIEDFSKSDDASATELLETSRIKQTILDSLMTMSIPLKSVGLLRYYEGLQINEIAKVLNIPKGTVNSRIDRIKKILKVDLEEQGISPKNYSIILTPSAIGLVYQKISMQYVLKPLDSVNIFNNVLKGRQIGTFSTAAIVAIGGAVATACIAGITLFMILSMPMKTNDLASIKTDKMESQVEKAKIDNISYDTSWTNKEVYIEVSTTNDTFDKILINGIETKAVSENGKYKIQLLRDNEVLDEREIEISNIDIHSPNGTFTQNGNVFTYYLNDDLSQINLASILFLRDGVASREYEYNPESNILVIVSEGSSTDQFFISDYAGNELEIIIE